MTTKKYKLNFLFLSDDAFRDERGKVCIIGIFDVINLKEFPGTLLKSVLVGNFSLFENKIGSLEIGINLLGPGERSIDLKIPSVHIPISPEVKKLGHVGFFLELGNLKFEEAGDYKFKVSVNNEELGEYKFKINKQESQTNESKKFRN